MAAEIHRRAVHALPSLVTTAGMLSGFASIISSFQGELTRAAWLIVAAALFDLFDGRVARATGTSTAFGMQYDSLSDLCSFGLAPAVLLYAWGLKELGVMGWLAAFLYFAGAAFRLARFNVAAGGPPTASRQYFRGLSSAIAAITVSGAVALNAWLLGRMAGLPGSVTSRAEDLSRAVPLLALGLAVLMVSTIRYRSFKELELRKTSLPRLLCLALVGLLFAACPPLALFTFALLYVVSGPFALVTSRPRTPACR